MIQGFTEMRAVVEWCAENRLSKVFSSWDESFLKKLRFEVESIEKGGIGIVAYGTPLYPLSLTLISDPPPLLFYRGVWPNQLPPCISVVGARKSDLSGNDIARSVSRKLVERGACVVSGLALGIDGAAHRGALEGGSSICPTIAVLGNGLATVYPVLNERLATEIVERGGLLLSQFEPNEQPFPSNFLNRNRVIAGLSIGALVIQAGTKSGSLVTVRHALEQGKDVCVVPGSIKDPRYDGSNELIRKGAFLVRSAEDVWEIFPGLNTAEEKVPTGKSTELEFEGTEGEIVRILKVEGSVAHGVLCTTLSERGDLLRALLELEIRGVIHRLPGNLYGLRA